MSMPLAQSVQRTISRNKESFPYFKLFCMVSKQITNKKDLKRQKMKSSKKQMIKTQENINIKGKSLKTPFQSNSSAFQPFRKSECQDSFAQEDLQKQRSLNIVDQKSFNSQSQILFRDIKKRSHLQRIIPINTIVLARCHDQQIWPGRVVNVRILQEIEKKCRKFFYDIELINRHCVQRQLNKLLLAQFNSETVQMLKRIKNDKKLIKALKIAWKLYEQHQGKYGDTQQESQLKHQKAQNSKIVKNIILIKHQQLKTTLQEKFPTDEVQNHQKKIIKSQYFVLKHIKTNKITQKWQPLNLVIQTPKVPLQYFASQDEKQTNSQLKIQFQMQDNQPLEGKQSTEKFNQNNDETYFSESGQNSIETDDNLSTKDCSNQEELRKVIKYLRKTEKRIQKKIKRSKRYSKFYRVFNLLNRPLEDFNKCDISKYSKIIILSIEICMKKLRSSEQYENKDLIEQLRKKLCQLYLILKEYKGDNAFVNELREDIIWKLEQFYKAVGKKSET